MNPWHEDVWTERDDLLLSLAVCDYWAERNREWIERSEGTR